MRAHGGKAATAKYIMAFTLAAVLVASIPASSEAAGWGRSFDYTGRNLGVGGHIGLGVATSDVGAGFSFGGSAKIQVWEGIYMDPGFNWWIKSGAWAISVQPAPQVIFRFRDFMVHPYAGLGPAFHITHVGGGDTYDVWGNRIEGNGDTNVKFGLHWTFGAEFALNERISLFNDYKFHLIFDSPDLFNIVVGAMFYL